MNATWFSAILALGACQKSAEHDCQTTMQLMLPLPHTIGDGKPPPEAVDEIDRVVNDLKATRSKVTSERVAAALDAYVIALEARGRAGRACTKDPVGEAAPSKVGSGRTAGWTCGDAWYLGGAESALNARMAWLDVCERR